MSGHICDIYIYIHITIHIYIYISTCIYIYIYIEASADTFSISHIATYESCNEWIKSYKAVRK